MSVVYWIFYTIFTKGVKFFPEQIINWIGRVGSMGIGGEEQTLQKVLLVNKQVQGQGNRLLQGAAAGTAALGAKMGKRLYNGSQNRGKAEKPHGIAEKS